MGSTNETVKLTFRSEAREAIADAKKLGGVVEDAGDKAERSSGRAHGGLLKWAVGIGGVVLGYKALQKAMDFVGDSIKEFVKFEKSMAEIGTITDLNAEEMKKYTQEVQNLAMAMGVDANDAAKALYQTISSGAGKNAEESFFIMAESMKFATASLTDTTAAVDVITTALNSYQLEASEATAVSDMLFTTIRLGKTTGEQLAGSLGRVIPIAATAGVSLDDLGASMVLLTRAGLSTDEAVTSLRALMLAIAAPTEQATKAIEALGLEMFNQETLGQEGGIFKILEELIEKGDGSIEVLAEVIPNIRALVGALAAGAQLDALPDILAEFANKAGATETALAKMMGTLGFDLQRIQVAWQVLQQNVGAGFAAMFGDDIKEFTDTAVLFVERLAEVGGAYTEAVKNGATDTEAMAAAFKQLGVVYDETLGPALDAALERAGAAISAWADEIDWAAFGQGAVEGIGSAVLNAASALTMATLKYFYTMGENLRAWMDAEFGEWDTWAGKMWGAFLDIGLAVLDDMASALQGLMDQAGEWLRMIGGGDPGASFGEEGGGRGARFQFGGRVMDSPGLDRSAVMVGQGERITREPVARNGAVDSLLQGLNSAGPASLTMNFPGVRTPAAAKAIAPRAASGFSRFQSVGGLN